MRTACLILLAVAACATPRPEGAIEVNAHFHEVPRNPYPGYHPDGVVVTRLGGESAWTKAGLLVNDVIESVNGEWTLNPEAFWKAVGTGLPRRVRILGSRAGPVGQYRIVAIDVAT